MADESDMLSPPSVSSLSSVNSDTTLNTIAAKLSKKRRKKLRQMELRQEALKLSQKIADEAKIKQQKLLKKAKSLTSAKSRVNPASGEHSTSSSPPIFKIPKLPAKDVPLFTMDPKSPLEVLEGNIPPPPLFPIFKKARKESVPESELAQVKGTNKENALPVGVSQGGQGKSITFEVPKNFHAFMPFLRQMAEASESLANSVEMEDEGFTSPNSPVHVFSKGDHSISSSEDEDGPTLMEESPVLPSSLSSLTPDPILPISRPILTPEGVESSELSESQKIKQQKVLDFANMKPGKTASRIQSQVDKIVDAKQLAPRLQPSVALAINEFFINSKYADELAELGKKYPKIENLDRQVPPILDTVLDNGAGITPNHVANDTALKNIQKGLMGVITVLAEGHSLALARGSEDSQLDDLGVKFEEAMKMVALASSGITIHRRQSLKNLLDAKYSKVLVNHSKITDFRYLFGGDLSEKKKETDIARGFAKAVFRQAPSLMSQQRGQARGGPQRGRGFSPQNAPRGRFDARSGSYPTNRGHYHQRGQSNQYQNQNWNNNQNYSRGGGRGSNRGGHNQSQRGRGNQQN